MDRPKRKHRRTGAPKGGRREGAGRPLGSANTLELGEVRAVKACKLRLPADATPEVEAVAERAFERLVDVMEGRVSYLEAGSILKAATRLREEACGPLLQKVEHTGKDGAPLVFNIDLGGKK